MARAIRAQRGTKAYAQKAGLACTGCLEFGLALVSFAYMFKTSLRAVKLSFNSFYTIYNAV